MGSPNVILGGAVSHILGYVMSLSIVIAQTKGESATLDPAGHVSVTLLESGAWSEEPSHGPKRRQLFFLLLRD